MYDHIFQELWDIISSVAGWQSSDISKGMENLLNELIAENFSNLQQYMDIQI
jgi:hypothetical protein